jgi:flagellar hook-associated protein FlgK
MSGLSNRSNQASSPLPTSASPETFAEDAIDVQRLRDWVGSVSLAEAVSNLMIYQWACQSSARLMADIDRMVDAGVDEKNS